MAKKMRTVETPPPPVCALPLEVPLQGFTPIQRVHVCLVGAGGTGGRVALLLPRLLRAGDIVSIIDHDVVEAKNLSRQHFHPADVGRAKAEVVAERLAAVAPEGLIVIPQVDPFVTALPRVLDQVSRQLTIPRHLQGTTTPYSTRTAATIYIGAVDNRQARAEIAARATSQSVAWIDAGNDFRTGQVCLNLSNWRLQPQGLITAQGQTVQPARGVRMEASRLCFPETLDPTLDAADAHLNCVGFDTQSVGVNALAATYVGNMLTWLLEGETIGVMAVFFSTKGGTSTFPIMSAVVDRNAENVVLGRVG